MSLRLKIARFIYKVHRLLLVFSIDHWLLRLSEYLVNPDRLSEYEMAHVDPESFGTWSWCACQEELESRHPDVWCYEI